MKLNQIAKFLERAVPLDLQESYDNCGLLAGEPETEIQAALITLDLTEAVLEEAIRLKCNLVISHHPVIFTGLKSLTGRSETERLVMRAIRQNIALYAMHTNLDNHHEGVNRLLAEKLGVLNPAILSPAKGKLMKLVTFCPHSHAGKVREALFSAGAGHIGNYDGCSFSAEGQGTFRASEQADPFVGKKGELHTEAEQRIETIFPMYLEKYVVAALLQSHPYEEPAYDLYQLHNEHPQQGAGMVGELPEAVDALQFLAQVKKTLSLGAIRYAASGKKTVKRIAFCGGSGSFLIKDAMASKCDIYLTGDLKYHDFFIPENRMMLADIGHYESEQFTKELIYTLLKKNFTTFALHISGTNTNPVNYL